MIDDVTISWSKRIEKFEGIEEEKDEEGYTLYDDAILGKFRHKCGFKDGYYFQEYSFDIDLSKR